MEFTGGWQFLPGITGAVLVVVLVSVNVRRFKRERLTYHVQSIGWGTFLVAADLLHIVIDHRGMERWPWTGAVIGCLALYVAAQSLVLRLSWRSWSVLLLEGWIVGAAIVLAVWSTAGLAGQTPAPSVLDVAHVTVTAWMAVCVIRKVATATYSVLGWWYASVAVRCVAIFALVADHLTSLSGLAAASSVLLAASYAMLTAAIVSNVGRRKRDEVGVLWQTNMLLYVVVIVAIPVIMVGFTVEDLATNPLYVVLTGSGGVALCLRTIMSGSLSRTLLAELTERSAQLHDLAFRDPLTGLANRSHFVDRLSAAMDRAGSRTTVGVYVLFVDLDGFKRVNDAAGHAAGDSVLRDVAVRLEQATSKQAFLGRLGGDEFAVLLEGATLDEAKQSAGRIADTLSAAYAVDHGSFVIGASVGIAAARDADDAEDLLRNGDLAMYAAKRDQLSWTVYAPCLHEDAVRRADDDRMYAAVLDEQRFELRYQPIVDQLTGDLVSCEALLRWRDRVGTLRPPAGLLEFAQRNGQMSDLSMWTIGSALAQISRLREQLGDLAVSVNLAPMELMRPGLVSMVCDELAVHELPPEALVLEITEQVLIEEPARAIRILADLRAQQIRIAIDDFGTGFSSLAYLVDLPVDLIKLDQSFVHSLPRHPPALIVVSGVVDIADQLGLSLVAEGVETVEQAELLAGLGCRYCQGSHFYPPMAPDDLMALAAGADRAAVMAGEDGFVR